MNISNMNDDIVIYISEGGEFFGKVPSSFALGESGYKKVYKSVASKSGIYSKYQYIKFQGVVVKVK